MSNFQSFSFSDFSDFSVYSVCFFIISGHFGFGILQIAEDHLLGAQISRCRQAHEAQPSAQLQAPGARQVVVALRQGTGHGQTGGPKLPRQVRKDGVKIYLYKLCIYNITGV